jgi:DNA-binding PadR family transcriptional regulator
VNADNVRDADQQHDTEQMEHGPDSHGRRHNHERGRRWHERVRRYMEGEGGEHWFFGSRRFAAWCFPEGIGRANPFVGLMLSKGGGVLPLIVMHMIAQGHRYGNDIMREIGERTRGTWAANPGAVYPLLRLLERQGLVTAEWEDVTKRTRRMYQLTEAGRQEYVTLKDLVEPGLHEAVQIMMELFAELYPEQS